MHQWGIWSVDDCVSHCHPCPIQVVLTLVLVGSSSIDYTCMYVYTVYKVCGVCAVPQEVSLIPRLSCVNISVRNVTTC